MKLLSLFDSSKRRQKATGSFLNCTPTNASAPHVLVLVPHINVILHRKPSPATFLGSVQMIPSSVPPRPLQCYSKPRCFKKGRAHFPM